MNKTGITFYHGRQHMGRVSPREACWNRTGQYQPDEDTTLRSTCPRDSQHLQATCNAQNCMVTDRLPKTNNPGHKPSTILRRRHANIQYVLFRLLNNKVSLLEKRCHNNTWLESLTVLQEGCKPRSRCVLCPCSSDLFRQEGANCTITSHVTVHYCMLLSVPVAIPYMAFEIRHYFNDLVCKFKQPSKQMWPERVWCIGHFVFTMNHAYTDNCKMVMTYYYRAHT